MRRRNWLALTFAAASLPGVCWAKTYTVDPDHSSVTFRVRHLFTEVEGRFRQYKGTIVFDPATPETAKVQGTIAPTSVDTDVKQRDDDLRSSNFFDVAKFPEMSFESTQITDVNKADNSGKVHGNLTMHGVTKPVVLDAKFNGEAKDPWGNNKAGLPRRGKDRSARLGLELEQSARSRKRFGRKRRHDPDRRRDDRGRRSAQVTHAENRNTRRRKDDEDEQTHAVAGLRCRRLAVGGLDRRHGD
jgi:polyisoprenoid-binding protein YceI